MVAVIVAYLGRLADGGVGPRDEAQQIMGR